MSIPVPEKRILDFEKMGFGMFVHWGLYSQIGKGEWIFHHTDNLEMNEYKKLKDSFTAEDFYAEKLVLTAKNAGCKYLTLTTRHHEGFSLYDTCGLNDFDAPHSPAGRDLVKEFVNACNKHAIVPFFYHTTLDWYNTDFENNFNKYLEYLRKSVEILCRNYGKIGGFWFDGNWSKPADTDWEEDELYATIKKYQPDAIIVNNTGMRARGKLGNPEIDSITFEQGIPTPMNREGMTKYIAAEMCETINDHWGIFHMDFNYKSPKELIESLCNCRKVGANYLLNITTAQGGIDPIQSEFIKVIGKWMNIYGEAIYNGNPYPAGGIGNNFILKGEKELYLFFFDLAKTGSENVTVSNGNYCGCYSLGNVPDQIVSIEWMDNNEQLNFVQKDNMLTVNATGYPYGVSTCVRVAKANLSVK